MKTVKLTTPLRGARGTIDFLEFREPRFEDFMTLGDPRVPIVSGETFVWQPVPELVRQYAERLLVAQGDANLNVMAGASLRDAQAIQECVLGFFRDTDRPTKSADSGETSSSSQDATSPASTA